MSVALQWFMLQTPQDGDCNTQAAEVHNLLNLLMLSNKLTSLSIFNLLQQVVANRLLMAYPLFVKLFILIVGLGSELVSVLFYLVFVNPTQC